MPINPEFRALYPPDWRELSCAIRFGRAGGRCEWCGRPHGKVVLVIAAGGWLNPATGERHDDRGRSLGGCPRSDWPEGRLVKTILTCAHLDQNPAHNDPAHRAALCPRCHLRHDRRQHIQYDDDETGFQPAPPSCGTPTRWMAPSWSMTL